MSPDSQPFFTDSRCEKKLTRRLDPRTPAASFALAAHEARSRLLDDAADLDATAEEAQVPRQGTLPRSEEEVASCREQLLRPLGRDLGFPR